MNNDEKYHYLKDICFSHCAKFIDDFQPHYFTTVSPLTPDYNDRKEALLNYLQTITSTNYIAIAEFNTRLKLTDPNCKLHLHLISDKPLLPTIGKATKKDGLNIKCDERTAGINTTIEYIAKSYFHKHLYFGDNHIINLNNDRSNHLNDMVLVNIPHPIEKESLTNRFKKPQSKKVKYDDIYTKMEIPETKKYDDILTDVTTDVTTDVERCMAIHGATAPYTYESLIMPTYIEALPP